MVNIHRQIKSNTRSVKMRELNVNEIEQVSGGWVQLLILVGEGAAIAGGMYLGRAAVRYVKSLF